jgi:hypothetical protein
MKVTMRVVVLLILVVSFVACDKETANIAAPIGDLATLEKLADSYRKMADRLPANPRGLMPKDKRRFVEQVFEHAGYNYSATLFALANTQLDPFNQHQSDLAELLFLPQLGAGPNEISAVYTPAELQAIETIQKIIK